MKKDQYLKIGGVIILVIVLLMIFFMVRDVQDTDSKNINSMLNIKMKFLQTPKLNDTVDIELRASASLEKTRFKKINATIRLFLPEGFEYIRGDLKPSGKGSSLSEGVGNILKDDETFSWKGVLKKNETKILNIKVKAVKSGNLWIVLSSILTKIGENQDVNSHLLYVTFDKDSGKILEENELDFPIKSNGTTKTK